MLCVEKLESDLLEATSFTLTHGECLIVTGASGSGKSLLLRAIADLDVNAGRVMLDDINRDEVSAANWRQKVVYLPAESGWWAENVVEHFKNPDQMTAVFNELNLSPDCLSWQVTRLSTGEKQRLALARALENTPAVLLLDEPTSALDKKNTLSVENLLKAWQRKGCILIIVTHDSDQAARFAGKVLDLSRRIA